jgi:hypothetical protein
MSVMGRSEKSGYAIGKSALPLRTDIVRPLRQVRKVPIAEVTTTFDRLVDAREL